MYRLSDCVRLLLVSSILLALVGLARAQRSSSALESHDNQNFGPVMRAYLGYLRDEQEVVDDRISRREITFAYYRRNSNRIRALRDMAVRLVRQSRNDYVPELEAVTLDELGTLFEKPPTPTRFRPNEVLDNKFRFLGVVRTGELFYLFARLDAYEQAELIQRQNRTSGGAAAAGGAGLANGQPVGQSASRPRRAVP